MKPGPPLPRLLWGCVKPGPPVPVPFRPKWGVLVKQGWSGFQRVCGCDTWTSPAWGGECVRETWSTPAEGVAGVCETGATRAWGVECVGETWTAPACSIAPEMGSFGEAGVVWVSWVCVGCEAGVVRVSAVVPPPPPELELRPGVGPRARRPWHRASPPCCAHAKGAGPRRSRPFD